MIEVLVDRQGNDPQAVIDVIHEVCLHTCSSLKSRVIELYFNPLAFLCLDVEDHKLPGCPEEMAGIFVQDLLWGWLGS